MSKTLLLFEDNRSEKDAYCEWLADSFDVTASETVLEATELLANTHFDIAVLDMASSPDDPEGGLRLLQHIADNSLLVKPIVLTGAGTIENCVKSMTLGAVDYIEKGRGDTPDRVLSAALTACQRPLQICINLTGESEEVFNQLSAQLSATHVEVVREAIRMFRWGVTQWLEGRRVLSELKGQADVYPSPFGRRHA